MSSGSGSDLPRATDADVRAIVEGLGTAINTAPCIRMAHLIVKTHVEPAGVATEEVLVEIERWLAGHLASIKDKSTRVTSLGLGGKLNLGYSNPAGLNLQATLYGQQVLLLDPTGTLAALNSGSAKIQLRSSYVGRMPDGETQDTSADDYWVM